MVIFDNILPENKRTPPGLCSSTPEHTPATRIWSLIPSPDYCIFSLCLFSSGVPSSMMTQAAWLRLSSVGEWKEGSSTSTSPLIKQGTLCCVRSKCTEVGTPSIITWSSKGDGCTSTTVSHHWLNVICCLFHGAQLVERGINSARVRGLSPPTCYTNAGTNTILSRFE